MNVAELRKILEQYPAEMPVVYGCYSEFATLTAHDIDTRDLCPARPDGWVHRPRPGGDVITYLVVGDG